MTTPPPSITCPQCHRTSYHPRDIEEGYCGNCHAFTSPAADQQHTEVLHIAEGDTPMRDEYRYSATGVGVHRDVIQAVLQAWASISPNGDPATTLRSVNDGHINQVDSLARITAQGVLMYLRDTGHLGQNTESRGG
jgi:hypothetical protein